MRRSVLASSASSLTEKASSSLAFASFFESATSKDTSAKKKRKTNKRRRKASPSPSSRIAGDIREEPARKRGKSKAKDPSARYLSHPLQCPTVQSFQDFFDQERLRHPTLHQQINVHLGPVANWRTVAKLSVRAGKRGVPVIGRFAPGSHRVVPLPESVAHHPSIDKAVQTVQASALKMRVKAYDGNCHGGLSYLGLSVETRTKLVQLVLVWNAATEAEVDGLRAFVADLERRHRWHSIWNHFNKCSKHDNAIYGREGSTWELASSGSDRPIREILPVRGGLRPKLCFPPNVFRQANLTGFAKIVTQIREWMLLGGVEKVRPRVCVELYGGVGTIGLNVLDLVQDELSCSDANPFNSDAFHAALADLNDAAGRAAASYTTCDATGMAKRGALNGDRVDIAIVDPPRKGLDDAVIRALRGGAPHRPRRLVYVSCGFKAFKRDYSRLVDDGG